MAQPEQPAQEPDPQPDGPPSVRDRWWFSSALQVVAGAAVIGFQWGPISRGSANAANWVVALLGLLVLLYGVVGGLQASRQR